MKQKRIFVGDFETTVYEGQTFTEVWASALVELGTEEVIVDNSIENFFNTCQKIKSDMVIYFHNLKFDGNFILDHLLRKGFVFNNVRESEMRSGEFKSSISDKGAWYVIVIKIKSQIIEIRDSLKLLPFSVKRIGKAFKTKHQKTSIEYEGFRYAEGIITDEEKEYIANDVLVVKEALEIMFDEGHTKLTIGACCMDEFKRTIGKEDYKDFFQTYLLLSWTTKYMGAKTLINISDTPTVEGIVTLLKGKKIEYITGGSPQTLTVHTPQICLANQVIITLSDCHISGQVERFLSWLRNIIILYGLDVVLK